MVRSRMGKRILDQSMDALEAYDSWCLKRLAGGLADGLRQALD